MKFHYLEQGQGLPLVMLHGFCESPAIFDGLLPLLPSGHHILRPLLPGHQGTPWNPPLTSMEAAADWLRDFLDHLGIDRCTLLGHSLGGYIAAAMADRHPQYLERIIMLHTTAQADLPDRRAKRQQIRALVERHGPAPFLKTFVPSLFHQPKAEWITTLTEITQQTATEAILGFILAMENRSDRLAVLKEGNIPTLYLVGEEDKLVDPKRNTVEFADWPSVEVALLAGVGHMGMYEAPEEVAKAVTRFLERNEN